MIPDPKNRRKELIIIIISGVLITFILSVLANYIYNWGVKCNITIIPYITILLLSIIFISQVVRKYASEEKIEISFPILFDHINLRFYDLPFNPGSIHSRVGFANLNIDRKNILVTFDDTEKFWSSEFETFIDYVIQNFLIIAVIDSYNLERKVLEKFTINKLPESIRENEVFKNWWDKSKNDSIYLPKNTNISTFGRSNAFIKIENKYGEIDFIWKVIFNPIAELTKIFIDQNSIEASECHEFIIEIRMKCKYHFNMFNRKNMDLTYNWINSIFNIFSKFDWEKNCIQRVEYLLQKIRPSVTLNA